MFELKDFIGKKGVLKDFEIVEMTEVCRVDEAGIKISSMGFFRKEDIAKAFAGSTDKNYLRTEKKIVLTNGIVAYLVSEKEPLNIIDDEKAMLTLKKKALAKLTPEEIKLLGL